MVFLSAFTTKTAVYVLLRGFPGTELLIYVGLAMVFYGIIYALLENDMRRILAYSIVNQVGFMVTGIGIGTEMALNGAAAHAFTHILYKALLLMSAGSVLLMTGRRKCTDLGGLFRTMPLTALCGIVGAAGDLVVSAHLRVRQQVDDHARRRATSISSSSGCCSPPLRPACSCTPASSSPGSCSSRKTRACARRNRRGTCGRDAVLSRCCASGSASSTSRSTGCCPTPVNYEPYTGVARGDAVAAAALLRARVLRDARLAASHADRHARCRLGLPGAVYRRPALGRQGSGTRHGVCRVDFCCLPGIRRNWVRAACTGRAAYLRAPGPRARWASASC